MKARDFLIQRGMTKATIASLELHVDITQLMEEYAQLTQPKPEQAEGEKLPAGGNQVFNMNPTASEESGDVSVFTFDEFVDYGLLYSDNIVDGMPWSFDFYGHPVTHENDRCYLIGDGESITPSNLLIIANRELIIKECPQCKALRDAITEAGNKPTPEAITKMSDLSNINMNEPYCISNASEESESNKEGEVNSLYEDWAQGRKILGQKKGFKAGYKAALSSPAKMPGAGKVDELWNRFSFKTETLDDEGEFTGEELNLMTKPEFELALKAALSAFNNVPTEKEIEDNAADYAIGFVGVSYECDSNWVNQILYACQAGAKWAINKMKGK